MQLCSKPRGARGIEPETFWRSGQLLSRPPTTGLPSCHPDLSSGRAFPKPVLESPVHRPAPSPSRPPRSVHMTIHLHHLPSSFHMQPPCTRKVHACDTAESPRACLCDRLLRCAVPRCAVLLRRAVLRCAALRCAAHADVAHLSTARDRGHVGRAAGCRGGRRVDARQRLACAACARLSPLAFLLRIRVPALSCQRHFRILPA